MLLDKVREAAKEKGMTLKEVAEKAEMKYDSLLRWNDSMPNALTLASVARVLGTTSEELLKEE